MDTMSRRGFLQALALSTGALGISSLAACSSKQGGQASSASPGSAGEAAGAYVMSFVVVSDTHISPTQETNVQHFRAALADIRAFDPTPACIVIVGDMADHGLVEEYDLVRALCEEANVSYDDYIVKVMGNHEQYSESFDPSLAGTGPQYTLFMEQARTSRVYYDTVVEGQHFICLGPDENFTGDWARFNFTTEQIEWLEQLLDEDAKQGRISFVFCHEPLFDTVQYTGAGSWSESHSLEDDDELADVIKGRPHVVYFSGHTHLFPDIARPDGAGPLYVNDGAVGPGQRAVNARNYPDDFTGSNGWLVTVFEDRIEFKARDFKNGNWIDGLDYTFELEKA